MTRTRLLVASLLAVTTIASCTAFKDALTGHADTVARAGNEELTVDELAQLMAGSEAPLRPDVARTLSQLWVNYQLLGHAGAQRDSLANNADADLGMWSALAQLQTRKYYETISQSWGTADTASLEQKYNDGELLAAAHILLSKQPEGLSATANDSIRREAERLAATVNSANFAAVAKARSQDPGSKDRGGDYGVFPPGQMVPEFDAGIRSVKPGEISKVVETQFGYHIIRRSTWPEIKDQFAEAYVGLAQQKAESTYFEGIEKQANVNVKDGAPKLVKAIAEDVDAYRNDKSVIATARSGNLTAMRLAEWLAAFPAQSRMRAQVMQAPDSLIPMFVKNIMRNELMLRAADSAGVGPDSAETAEIRQAFFGGAKSTMEALNVAPSQLDGAVGQAARDSLAAARIDGYVASLLRNEGEFVEVPEQLVIVLRKKFESRIVPAALDRALAEATKLRTAADSLKDASLPPTQVPMPAPGTAPTTPPQP
ncbi:MAG: peptidylprolyl isomerase [Gemmatimonadaceae bacterium]